MSYIVRDIYDIHTTLRELDRNSFESGCLEYIYIYIYMCVCVLKQWLHYESK
jgi:hypothetical protein